MGVSFIGYWNYKPGGPPVTLNGKPFPNEEIAALLCMVEPGIIIEWSRLFQNFTIGRYVNGGWVALEEDRISMADAYNYERWAQVLAKIMTAIQVEACPSS